MIDSFYYTYVHKRLDDGLIFNVGKGHAQRAWESTNRNNHWHNVVNKHGFVVEIIKSNLIEQEALDLETQLIAEGRKLGWPLVNKTSGGEGISGYKHTNKTKKLISESFKKRIIDDAQRKKWAEWGHTLGLQNVQSGKLAYARSKAPKDPFKSIRTFEFYSKAGKIGGKITGKKHIESGHIQALGKNMGPLNGKKTCARRWGVEMEPGLWISKKTGRILLDEREMAPCL